MRKLLILGLAVVVAAAVLHIPIQGTVSETAEAKVDAQVNPIDLESFSEAKPGRALDLLFIHHSCGGQLLADPGEKKGANNIMETHPNGGGLRSLLESAGYAVHEASRNSMVGEDTDIFHWLPKFRGMMGKVLACAHQDETLPDGKRNRIVLFKSCYPNNLFHGMGTEPGKPEGPGLTYWNARATYTALLDEFAKQPETLFVCVTAPPNAPKPSPEPLWKYLARIVLGKTQDLAKSSAVARQFNDWLKDRDGWLEGYGHENVAVFDYYDVLTGEGKSNLSLFATGDGSDSHPSREGNTLAAKTLVPFLNRAVRRAGLSQ